MQSLYKPLLTASLLAFASSNAQALTITANYASGVTAAEQTAFNYAAQQFDSLFTNNYNFVINVNLETNPQPGDLGFSTANTSTYSYSQLQPALNSNLTQDGLTSALLPATNPVTTSATLIATDANAIVLGLQAQNPNTPYTIGTFTFNPQLNYGTTIGSIQPDQYDFIGTAIHEISELLGRQGLDSTAATLDPIDLFRYTGLNQEVFTGLNSNYFSLDKGATAIQYFSTDTTGDLQDWNSVSGVPLFNANDAINASTPSGVYSGLLTTADIKAMEAIGYTVSAVPVPNMAIMFGASLAGFLGLKRRRAA